MGRKSRAGERREELLDAFERCIVQYGLEGTSLEQVADEAGMTRSIIRHYIGNRDELVDALIERIIAQYAGQLETAYADVPPEQAVGYTLDMMFSGEQLLDPRDTIIITVLMTAKERYPQAKKLLVAMFEAMIDSFGADLERSYPQAPPGRCRQIAYAVICMAEMHESLMWLGMDRGYNAAARAAAETLIGTLAYS
ncbi:MAG TPA: TetR family transcriptional regulator [Herpetosiphonaceae bacterium]|nr:TetR family transcriptional regulator [Herpetosiphonaceae bacterium]